MEKKQKTVVALLYDFDKTLCTQDMQNYSFIPSLGMSPHDFWEETNEFVEENQMDGILAYMYRMVRKSREKGVPLTRETLRHCGQDISFFPGVTDWFSRISRFGDLLGIEVEHYVISSGLREIIEGTEIANYFKEVYACEFFYDENGIPVWPKLAVNFTAKTQFIYRINKGVLNVSDDKALNASMPDEHKRISFVNMVYIGDGLSDVPCMKMMRSYGGQAIAVYQDANRGAVEELLRKERVDFIYPVDYREGSPLENTVKNILRKMAVSQQLYEENKKQRQSIVD